jgi:hypothetical protein
MSQMKTMQIFFPANLVQMVHYVCVISQPIVRSTVPCHTIPYRTIPHRTVPYLPYRTQYMFLTFFCIDHIPLCFIIDKVNKYTPVVFHGNDKQFVCLVQYVSYLCYDLLCQQLHTVRSQFFVTF